jgi:hypothetical protein
MVNCREVNEGITPVVLSKRREYGRFVLAVTMVRQEFDKSSVYDGGRNKEMASGRP